jgi:dihydroneopterin aldolase
MATKLRPALFVVLLALQGMAVEIRLQSPKRVGVQNGKLVVDAQAGPDLVRDEIRAYLNYGIVLTFTYFIELREKHWLLDEALAQVIITKRLSYDLWTEQYLLETSRPRMRQTVYKDLDSLRPELEVLAGVPVCEAGLLRPGGRYYFRTRNTLKVTQLNSFFHVLFNLLSVFKYKTTWLTSPEYSGAQLMKVVPP